MKILLVDDSKSMRSIQRKILSAQPGYEFAEAGDGIEALAAIAATPGGFDLVLVDWNMPNMDGITLVKAIREKDKRTTLIMATTEGEKARVVEAINAGVNNYVVKPFTPEHLTERVVTTMAKRRAA